MNVQANVEQAWAQSGRQPRIAIIGAGMSGIASVVKLRKAGYTDLTVFEKTDRVGGTWRENTYPGLSCDVPSRWYSFTFALKADWTHRYSYGPEIQAYMEETAQKFGVTEIVRFNTPVTDLKYEAPVWRLTAGDGSVETYDLVISATGVLHQPVLPDIEGLDSFAGAKFHSARWDHSVDLTGKRVGVIGAGSTAAQIIGAIADQVDELYAFQRTPQWMVPMKQKTYSKAWNRLLATFPILQKVIYEFYHRMMMGWFAKATIGDKKKQDKISEVCRQNLEENVPDPELRKKLTPDYQAACKRLIFCSDFYPAISRPNAHLITEKIARVTPDGIETVDGEMHKLDVLVMATGFNPGAFILPTKVTGENGLDLETFWDEAPRAHRAVSVPGFPNLWFLEGPTGPVGNMSLIMVTEHQLDYVIAMIDRMKEDGLAAIAAREDAFKRYNEAMNKQLPQTVWVTGGCDSWYIDKTGQPNLYPFHPDRYLKAMLNPDFSEFRLMRHAEASGETAPVEAATAA